MASIVKRDRKDGTVAYLVVYKFEDGRQGGLTFDDWKKAEAFQSTVDAHGAKRALDMHNIDAAPRRRDSKHGTTVAEWVRHHIDHLTGLEQYTIDTYNRYLENDIKPLLGDIPLADLQAEDIARWVKRMETEPSPKTKRVVSPKTIANRHGFLSGALAAAVGRHIQANPCAGRTLPRKTGDDDDDDEAEVRMLSRDEFDRLLAAGTVAYWRPLIDFLVTSGCRWGEVAALRPADVNRSAGTVKIRRAWKKSSKGYHVGPTKTKRSKRTINLPARILEQLDYSHEWLFTNTAGRPLRYHSFKTNIWNRAVAKAALDPAPSPHALRHTCASWMLNAGIPITTVSRHLGHESIKITADIYGDVDRTSHEAAAALMGELLE
jgi:integrase